MKITTKGHYGLHAMIELAHKEGQGPMMIREMAKRHGISEKYLEQIMRLLRQAGLVESSRGAKGGFWLAKTAKEIKALEILEALERETEPALTDRRARKGGLRRCAVLELWHEAEEAARCSWSGKTLAEMAARQDSLDRASGAMDYSI
jgi:Rrf2 family cysteine metabolism transcriptional repressor